MFLYHYIFYLNVTSKIGHSFGNVYVLKTPILPKIMGHKIQINNKIMSYNVMEFNLCGVNPDRHNDLWPWGIKGFQEKEDEYKSLSVRPLLMNNSGLMLYYSSQGTVSYSWKRCFNSCTKQENGVVVVTWFQVRWGGCEGSSFWLMLPEWQKEIAHQSGPRKRSVGIRAARNWLISVLF